MPRLTKEKLLALVAVVAAAVVISGLQLPRIEDVPSVPPEEGARAYRTISSGPRLAPEQPFRAGLRDPFAVEDPWKEAAPALLALPPVQGWPRALPGGPSATPRSPHDRLLVRGRPRPADGGGR